MPTIEKNFDKSELVAIVSAETGFDRDVVRKVSDKLFETIIDQVCLLGYAEMHGFGSFKLKKHAPVSGIAPSGKQYDSPERLSIDFNAFIQFRSALEALTQTPVIP